MSENLLKDKIDGGSCKIEVIGFPPNIINEEGRDYFLENLKKMSYVYMCPVEFKPNEIETIQPVNTTVEPIIDNDVGSKDYSLILAILFTIPIVILVELSYRIFKNWGRSKNE